MKLTCEATPLPGVLLLRTPVFRDPRGLFMELHQNLKYQEVGIPANFVQDNLSLSRAGALRGLHYQLRHAQAKLVSVLRGSVFDVVVDLRQGSPAFGKWYGVVLSEENNCQLFIPEGLAHGFCVTSPEAMFFYKCSDYYSKEDEYGVHWSDPGLAIRWPVNDPVLSEKDQALPPLRQIPERHLPVWAQTPQQEPS